MGMVRGQNMYETTLHWLDPAWDSDCTCPMGSGCKHSYALGLEWLEACGAELSYPAPGLQNAAGLSASTKKPTFRNRWQPVIEGKLGRLLTSDEGAVLGQLSTLFTMLQNGWGRLVGTQVERCGFHVSAQAGGGARSGLAYDGWWDPQHPPADPWALWQFIAYDYETSGLAIPAVLAPMTDTAAVRASVGHRLVQREVELWHQALHPAVPPARRKPAKNREVADVRLRLQPEKGFFIETRTGSGSAWKPPAYRWISELAGSTPADFVAFPPAAAALAIALAAEAHRGYGSGLQSESPLSRETAGRVLAFPAAREAIVLPDGSPWRVEAAPLTARGVVLDASSDRLGFRLHFPDGRPVPTSDLVVERPEALYLAEGRIHRGPPPLPAPTIATAALADPVVMGHLRSIGVQLPASLELRVRRVEMAPRLRLSLEDSDYTGGYSRFRAALFAESREPACAQEWRGPGGWLWCDGAEPPDRGPDDPLLEFDRSAAVAVGARFGEFKLSWNDYLGSWSRTAGRAFPEEFVAWHASLPPGITIETSPELAGLIAPPLRGRVEFAAKATGESRDWFDLTVELRVEDTTLTREEIALLLKARGKWVRLPRHGWRRLEVGLDPSNPAAGMLDRLGLRADEMLEHGKPSTHRLHALQLASEAEAFESRDAGFAAALRKRAAALAAVPAPPIPRGLEAVLRPYQAEGFHFLSYLSANGFGGVLADDMGLGKTVQALAWLLHLAGSLGQMPGSAGGTARRASFRALVVCPKSVVHGWLAEAARFAPGLAMCAFASEMVAEAAPPGPADGPAVLVANYAQLRINSDWLSGRAWDAVILDEAQFIKNPSSRTAAAARALPSANRVVLTGTPIENQLLDLWSLFAFAQPGLLGSQAAFRRQYSERDADTTGRLRRRVRHFMLRRTKAQVAADLPSRTEDELVVELEGEQRKLYDAELKRARAQLLGVETDRALDKVRFNVLSSLLRLRQICCHPVLVDPAHAALPSAKLDALLERIEELRDEGHQVLVFSQFVEMLKLVRAQLVKAGVGHLMLTGETENRAELVEKFQADRGCTVFLLSLRAAGFGLNLTAASYAILCDPWWNPAVEAQAIDRTHRIGQTRPVTAYRLIAENTVEQKIRELQREKSALASAVVTEESLASVLDLDSLRRILA